MKKLKQTLSHNVGGGGGAQRDPDSYTEDKRTLHYLIESRKRKEDPGREGEGGGIQGVGGGEVGSRVRRDEGRGEGGKVDTAGAHCTVSLISVLNP